MEHISSSGAPGCDSLISTVHPSKDNTYRFSLDEVLRKHGFKIHSRLKEEEAIWDLQGVRFSESEAILRLSREEVKQAERYERSYWRTIDARTKNALKQDEEDCTEA